MYIGYIVGSLKYISGGVRVITEHTNGLVERGHKVELWVKNEVHTQYFKSKAIVKPLDPVRLTEPDIIVMTDPLDIPLVAVHRGSKKSYLLMQHDNEWLAEISGQSSTMWHLAENMGLFSSNAWGIIAVSSWVQQIIQEKYGIASHLVPNGVDPEIFHPAKPVFTSTNPIILIFYAPQDWKGFPDAISAALELKAIHPNLEIATIGGILMEQPVAHPAFHNFSFPITAFNLPDQASLAGIYSSASVFVSASWKEGFGMPGLEAMACGVPLVTTDSGGVREYADPDLTALVVPPKDVGQLANAIRRILKDPTLRAQLSQNGLQKASQFRWDISTKKLEQIFNNR